IEPPELAARLCGELAEAAGMRGMVGGQADDLELTRRAGEPDAAPPSVRRSADWHESDASRGSAAAGADSEQSAGRTVPPEQERLAVLRSLHERKTGALLRASLCMGGLVAGAEGATLAALDSCGAALGLAFQVTDDLLDVQGAQERLGKRVGKDALQHKLTYPALLGVEGSRQRAAQLGRQAIEALEPLGDRAERLKALARLVIERDQ
ncbi:MAG: polyprenyl synthetase family protein, partial [Pirellulales bacterium]